MSNVYNINITCPRCQFTGDVKADFPCDHAAARKGTALEKLLKKCATDAARIALLREALALANEEVDAANDSARDLKRIAGEWEKAAKANMDLAEANMDGWEAEREACAKIAESYGIHWGESRNVPAELSRIAMGGASQIPSVEIAAAIRERKP